MKKLNRRESERGFILWQTVFAVGILTSLAVYQLQDFVREQEQAKAKEVGFRIAQYNNAIVEFMTANGNSIANGTTLLGTKSLRSAAKCGAALGSGSADYLPCSFPLTLPMGSYTASPVTTFAVSGGSVVAKTSFGAFLDKNGLPRFDLAEIARSAALQKGIDNKAPAALNSIFDYNIDTTPGANEGFLYAVVDNNMSNDAWLRTDGSSPMQGNISFLGANRNIVNADNVGAANVRASDTIVANSGLTNQIQIGGSSTSTAEITSSSGDIVVASAPGKNVNIGKSDSGQIVATSSRGISVIDPSGANAPATPGGSVMAKDFRLERGVNGAATWLSSVLGSMKSVTRTVTEALVIPTVSGLSFDEQAFIQSKGVGSGGTFSYKWSAEIVEPTNEAITDSYYRKGKPYGDRYYSYLQPGFPSTNTFSDRLYRRSYPTYSPPRYSLNHAFGEIVTSHNIYIDGLLPVGCNRGTETGTARSGYRYLNPSDYAYGDSPSTLSENFRYSNRISGDGGFNENYYWFSTSRGRYSPLTFTEQSQCAPKPKDLYFQFTVVNTSGNNSPVKVFKIERRDQNPRDANITVVKRGGAYYPGSFLPGWRYAYMYDGRGPRYMNFSNGYVILKLDVSYTYNQYQFK